jgi:hypothetical protein
LELQLFATEVFGHQNVDAGVFDNSPLLAKDARNGAPLFTVCLKHFRRTLAPLLEEKHVIATR